MTKRFVVTKDENTQTITYKEYDSLKGYDFKPKNKLSKEDIINVDEMVIINPSLIEKLISKKCKKTLERILKLISFIYDDDETGEESVTLALNEIAKFKELLDTKYKEYMKEKEYKLMLKKLEILENEVKLRKLYLNSKENSEKKSKGR
ncbi:MAG: hypothetical protein SOX86_01415 [Bacilli bacterium]|nr:hypothetical protein [Mycoplasmatota bacterium]MDY4236651.1 hypothetical protein [Bacilli bacterium]